MNLINSLFFRIAINFALALYSIIIFWGLYFGPTARKVLKEFEYNFYPFRTIFTYIIGYNSNNKIPFIINIIGNIVVLMPFGFLLPLAFKKQLNRLDKLLFATVTGILVIEMLQLVFKVGVFDVDDIILNSMGVVIGFVILKVIE